MEEQPYYSRRLTKKELHLWTGLHQPDEPSDDKQLLQKYMNFEDTMFFVSFLGDSPAGASSIFRDRTRMSMLLSSVRIPGENRKRLSRHIIKTSLPFFKSVALREADAVVNISGHQGVLPFPLAHELSSWAEDSLIENDFKEIETFYRLQYSIPINLSISPLQWDDQPTKLDEIKQLFWNVQVEERPDHAPFWLSIALAEATGTLQSMSSIAGPYNIVGWNSLGKVMVVSAILFDISKISHKQVTESIIHLAQKGHDSIILDMISEKSKLLEIFNKTCGEPTNRWALKLYRKRL